MEKISEENRGNILIDKKKLRFEIDLVRLMRKPGQLAKLVQSTCI